jgi:uridine kinase
VDLRPDAWLHLDQRGLSQLTASRLDRREGAAAHFPAAFLDALAARIDGIEPAGAAALVAIDGWGCGGKTALAEGLLNRLEPDVQYISTDEFFAGFGVTDPGPVAHLRWTEIEAALAGLRRDGRAMTRAFQWETSRIGPPAPIEGRAWLVEGLFTLRPELRGFYDLTIWVQGALETRMDRVVARDGAHMVPFWEREWTPRERAYIAAERPWLAADVVVAGAGLEIGALGASLRGCL